MRPIFFVILFNFFKLFILLTLQHGLHFCNPAYKDLWDL